MKITGWIGVMILLGSCTSQTFERRTSDDYPITIQHVMTSNKIYENEFAEKADRFELFNESDEEIVLEAGEWFVTDNPDVEPLMYELPKLTIPAEKSVVIWCDDADVVADDVHTNFKLKPNEVLALLRLVGDHIYTIDEVVTGQPTDKLN